MKLIREVINVLLPQIFATLNGGADHVQVNSYLRCSLNTTVNIKTKNEDLPRKFAV